MNELEEIAQKLSAILQVRVSPPEADATSADYRDCYSFDAGDALKATGAVEAFGEIYSYNVLEQNGKFIPTQTVFLPVAQFANLDTNATLKAKLESVAPDIASALAGEQLRPISKRPKKIRPMITSSFDAGRITSTTSGEDVIKEFLTQDINNIRNRIKKNPIFKDDVFTR